MRRSYSVLISFGISALAVFLVFALASGQGMKKEPKHGDMMGGRTVKSVTDPDKIEWSAAPDVLPAGAQMAVLNGDPGSKGIYVLRLKLPANYEIKPHWHPTEERLTVISGGFNVGMGDTFDKANGELFKQGGFGSMPAKMHHFAWTTEETVVQIGGMGPFAMTYVKAADDPRKHTAGK